MASLTVEVLRRHRRGFPRQFLFERHYQLDDVEAVGAQIVDKARFFSHLVGVDAEVLDDDLLPPGRRSRS